LLPVRNAQSTLSDAVLDLLEVVAELTPRFEIVIVDDGSVDATIEVADELAAYYPQVTAFRHAAAQGRLAAITTGLEHSIGEIVLLQDADCTVASDEICRLWQAIDAHQLVLGRPSPSIRWRWNRAKTMGPDDRGGFLMFHRQITAPIHLHLAQSQQLRHHLAAEQLSWHELSLHDRGLQPTGQRADSRASLPRGLAGLWSANTRSDSPQPLISKPRRPNYLERIREFAAGE
jgi:glycosyltransferase involved in cell wall biosynthesis